MKSVSFSVCLLLSLLFVAARVSESAVTCNTVAAKAASCVGFVTGKAPKPAPACCSGLQQLAKGATAAADRQAICRCLKAGVQNFAGVQDKFLSQIPASCGIKVGFPVSLKTDCNNTKLSSQRINTELTHASTIFHSSSCSQDCVGEWSRDRAVIK
ncbi:hypothetical protein H6P81_019721 [Aristolochia fimbriata]|uniref:Non-specific lipid-transfer protein n=1 Tax=Aristolochia fimbriata TaxID=158543 RepID=A0AAV7DVK6_ARIFI|nr:hypothetical protein H6P81_019721 [Aristolochia fimbriata]